MKENSINDLRQELEEKEKIFEEKYINDMKHNDYLSEEACKMRKEIFRLNREIREKEREENSMNEKEKKAIDFLKETNFDYLEYDMCVSSVEIISNLVERLQKENEELKSENGIGKRQYEELVNDYEELNQKNIELQKENEELKEKERSRIIGKYGDAEIHDVINRTLSNDYIPVQTVKDKIEEYKNMLKTCNKVKDIDRIKAINERILELQELLEGRKQNERKR